MLCLFLTQTRSDRSGEVNPEQTKKVQNGELVPFELKTMIKHQGALHVTLYDVKSGKPFGGIFFWNAGADEPDQGLECGALPG